VDLTEGDLSKLPWGKPYTEHKSVVNWRWKFKSEYDAEYSLADDRHHKSYWCRGDIIKFGSGYYRSYDIEEWREWFQPKEEYLKHLHENLVRDKRIPLYARTEFAMLLSRYKWTKYKFTTYRDYGSILMMLTGKNTGNVFKIYSSTPFSIYASFPYGDGGSYIDKMIRVLPQYEEIRKITKYVKSKSKTTGYTPDEFLGISIARSIFVEEMYHAFAKE